MTGICREIEWYNSVKPSTTQTTNMKENERQSMKNMDKWGADLGRIKLKE